MTKLKTKIPLRDLKSKSHEELLAIAQQAVKIRDAEKRRSIEFYRERMNEGQDKFHRSQKRYRFFGGGNRLGKTSAGAVELYWWCTGTHPYRKTPALPIKAALVVTDFENQAKNVLEPKIEELFPPGEVEFDRHQNGAIKRIYFKLGSTVDVFSHDQDPKVFEGTKYHVVWGDEPMPIHIFQALSRGLVDWGGHFYMTATALDNEWLYEKKDAHDADPKASPWDFFVFSSYINAKNIGGGDEALGKQRLDEYAAELDEETRAQRLDGQFGRAQGRIFKGWSRAIHVIDPFPIPSHWKIYESVDPHPQKPWAVTWTAVTPLGPKILLQSLYLDGSIDEIAAGILMGRARLETSDKFGITIHKTLIDNSASVPMWQKSFLDPTARRVSVREELENLIGPRAFGGPRVEVAPKNVQGKIDLMKRWLNVRDRGAGVPMAGFYVMRTEENEAFIKEIENYRWAKFQAKARQKEARGQPVKKDDDLIDTVLQVALVVGDGTTKESVIVDMTALGRDFSGTRSVHEGRDGAARFDR